MVSTPKAAISLSSREESKLMPFGFTGTCGDCQSSTGGQEDGELVDESDSNLGVL